MKSSKKPKGGYLNPILIASLLVTGSIIGDAFLTPETNYSTLLASSPSTPSMTEAEDQLARRVVVYMEAKGYRIDKDPGQKNIIYLEGVDWDGKPNENAPNQFNDRRIVLEYVDGVPHITGNWVATINPATYYYQHPFPQAVSGGGVAQIVYGQYTAWRVGIHGTTAKTEHEALIQALPVPVSRSWDRSNPSRAGAVKSVGLFAINQHSGYGYGRGDMGLASAGCLTSMSWRGQEEFMALIKQDPRYLADKEFTFTTTIIPGWMLLK